MTKGNETAASCKKFVHLYTT